MSMSPEPRADDRLIMLISRWLARHIGNAELERGLAESDRGDLAPGQLEAVDELTEHVKRAAPGARRAGDDRPETSRRSHWASDLAFRRCSRESSASAGASPPCGRSPRACGSRSTPETASQLGVGDSVSISGACLTATAVSNGRFSVTAVAETLDRTTLGRLAPEDEVNLETATRAGDPLGGHFVQGHVDAVGRIASVGEGRVWVEAEPEILRYCVEKGSITVDGVSLTIAALRGDAFEVALIPHTLEVTTLGAVEPGDEVNLEVDVLAKYVENLIDRDTISG
jgi:riboflavin synthase